MKHVDKLQNWGGVPIFEDWELVCQILPFFEIVF